MTEAAPKLKLIRKLGEAPPHDLFLARREDGGGFARLRVVQPGVTIEPGALQRWVEASRKARPLDHPGLRRVLGIGRLAAGRVFVAEASTEDARTLAELLAAEGALEPERAAHLFAPLFAALDVAHAAGLVHGDLTAAALEVTSGPDGEALRLGGFGLARLDRAGTMAVGDGTWWASPAAVAPEAVAAPPDARADLFALGVVVYEALAGAPPFEGPPAERDEPFLEALPAPFDRLVAALLEADPSRRATSAGAAWQAAFAPEVADEPTAPEPLPAAEAEEDGAAPERTPVPAARVVFQDESAERPTDLPEAAAPSAEPAQPPEFIPLFEPPPPLERAPSRPEPAVETKAPATAAPVPTSRRTGRVFAVLVALALLAIVAWALVARAAPAAPAAPVATPAGTARGR